MTNSFYTREQKKFLWEWRFAPPEALTDMFNRKFGEDKTVKMITKQLWEINRVKAPGFSSTSAAKFKCTCPCGRVLEISVKEGSPEYD